MAAGRIFRACLIAALLTAPAAAAQDAGAGKRAYGSFSELRSAVLEQISGASKRVWLVTDYLTDGETVTALYVAQYRKLDVRVLLGRGKANAYMSRLSYLKNQNVPVYLKPDGYKPGAATMLLADDALLKIDGELDFLAKYKRFEASLGTAADAQAFAAAFAGAMDLKVPAVAPPTPLVGRAGGGAGGGGGRVGGGGAAYVPPQPRYNPQDGAYVYDRAAQPRPADVPAKLPKTLKFEGRGRAPAAAPPAGGRVGPAPAAGHGSQTPGASYGVESPAAGARPGAPEAPAKDEPETPPPPAGGDL